MKKVDLQSLKKHLKSFDTVFSIKYIDNIRYYFSDKKVVAKIEKESFFISENIKK